MIYNINNDIVTKRFELNPTQVDMVKDSLFATLEYDGDSKNVIAEAGDDDITITLKPADLVIMHKGITTALKNISTIYISRNSFEFRCGDETVAAVPKQNSNTIIQIYECLVGEEEEVQYYRVTFVVKPAFIFDRSIDLKASSFPKFKIETDISSTIHGKDVYTALLYAYLSPWMVKPVLIQKIETIHSRFDTDNDIIQRHLSELQNTITSVSKLDTIALDDHCYIYLEETDHLLQVNGAIDNAVICDTGTGNAISISYLNLINLAKGHRYHIIPRNSLIYINDKFNNNSFLHLERYRESIDTILKANLSLHAIEDKVSLYDSRYIGEADMPEFLVHMDSLRSGIRSLMDCQLIKDQYHNPFDMIFIVDGNTITILNYDILTEYASLSNSLDRISYEENE